MNQSPFILGDGKQWNCEATDLRNGPTHDPGDGSQNVHQISRSLSFPLQSSMTRLDYLTPPGGFRDKISSKSLSLTVSRTDDGEGHSSRAEFMSSVASPPTSATSILPSSVDLSDTDSKKRQPLDEQIWAELRDCVLPDNTHLHQFLPATAIEKLVNGENLRAELDGITPEAVSSVLHKREKLFIILAMMDKSKAIYDLIQEGIHDDHLPFEIDANNRDILLCYDRTKKDGGPEQRVVGSLKTSGDRWNLFNIQQFYLTYQWRVLAPHFDINCPHNNSSAAKIEHHVFLENEVLPFTKPSDEADYRSYISGFSMVRKVCIHPAHRNPCLRVEEEVDCHATPFAIKAIDEKYSSAIAENEINKLKRFDGQEHRNRLIRLLCSFEYRRSFYLIFPWADANLEEFWREKFPKITDLRRGCSLTRWVAGELLGLARGLHLIHNPPPKDQDDVRINGRHGDIKPENILWFKDDEDLELHVPTDDNGTVDQPVQPTGMLKICDFGFVDFRSKASVSIVGPDSIKGRTHTYCAPECESISGEKLSQRYDSWSLGCVLLLFVTWYAQGWDGVEEFAKRRRSLMKKYERGEIWEDMFFQQDRMTKEVSVKPAVQDQIDMLRQHGECSEFFHEVLGFIQNKLLKRNQADRARTDELVAAFQVYYDRCFKDVNYCTARQHRGNQLSTTPRLSVTIPPPSPITVAPDTTTTHRPKRSWVSRVRGFFQRLVGSLRTRNLRQSYDGAL